MMSLMRRRTVLLAALTLTLTGACAPERTQAGSTPSPLATPSQALPTATLHTTSNSPWPQAVTFTNDSVDAKNADAVADAVAQLLTIHDTRTDHTPIATDVRAGHWYSSTVPHASIEAEVDRPSAHWQELTEHHGWDVVTNVDDAIDDPVPDTDTTAMRERTVTYYGTNADGWKSEDLTARYWISLTKNDGDWQVSALQTQSQ